MRVTVVGLWIYCQAYLDRKRGLSAEEGTPRGSIEARRLSQNETAGTLMIDIEHSLDTKLKDLKEEMMEALRKDMEETEGKIIAKLRDT